MLHYCTQHVLPLGNIHTTPSKIAHAAALLNLAVLSPWADDIQIDWEIRKSARSEILLGDFGGDWQRLCDPLAFSVHRGLAAKCTRSSGKPEPRCKSDSVGAEAYRDRVIDVSGLCVRIPAMKNWMHSDPRYVAMW